MFEQAIIDGAGRGRGWSFACSFAAQLLALGLILSIPLVFTYEISLDRRMATVFLPAPLAPPPPPPRMNLSAPAPPERYASALRQPRAIPDKVALIDDESAAPTYLAPAAGIAGGLPAGVAHGVPRGMLSDVFAPPPPPPIRVGGRVQGARLTYRVAPEYPLDALQEQISGTVELEAVVSFDGTIRDLKLIGGHPLLASAAVEAVEQWRYTPTRLNGQAVEVITNIEVIFNIENIEIPDKKSKRRQKRRNTRKRPDA